MLKTELKKKKKLKLLPQGCVTPRTREVASLSVQTLKSYVVTDRELHHMVQHLKFKQNLNKIIELLVDYAALNTDVAAKKLDILKHGCFTHISSTQQHRISAQSAQFKGLPPQD